MPYLTRKTGSIQKGEISKVYKEWEKLTSDPDILQMNSKYASKGRSQPHWFSY